MAVDLVRRGEASRVLRLFIPSLTSLKLLEEEIRFLLEEIHDVILKSVPETPYQSATKMQPPLCRHWKETVGFLVAIRLLLQV